MRNLVLNSLFIVFLSGCSLSVINNYRKVEIRPVHENELLSIINRDTASVTYKTQIYLFNNYYSGLMVIKSLHPGSTRVIFISEMGLTIFDFEFLTPTKENPEGFKIHYCLEEINKKTLISILKNDIGLVLMNNLNSGKTIEMKNKRTSEKVIKLVVNNKNNFYTINSKTNKISEILQTSGGFKKVKIDIFNNLNGVPDSIKLSHFNLRLKINLSLLKTD